MRILFVVHQFYPEFHSGTESVTLRLAETAQRAGHEVEILSSLVSQDVDRSWNLDKETDFYQYDHKKIAVVAIKRSDTPDDADYSLKAHRPLVDRISKYLRSRQFDCCHVMHTMRMASAVMAITESRIPYLLTVTDFFLPCYRVNLVNTSGQMCNGANRGIQCTHDCPTEEWNAKTLDLRAREAHEIIKSATTVVCPSGFVAAHLRREYPEVVVKVIPHDINLPASTELKETEKETGSFVFGYIGSLVEEKGIDLLVNAFCEAFDNVDESDVRLRIIGEIPVVPEFAQALVSSVSKNAKIEFLGSVPHTEIRSTLRSMDVLCIPSKVPETFSLVLHEAAALGVPALVSNMGAIKDAIEKTRGGMVVENNETASWSSALLKTRAEPMMVAHWKNNTGKPVGRNEEKYSYLGLYQYASSAGASAQALAPHTAETLNWKKRLKRFLWPKFQARGKARWFLLTLEYRGKSVRMLAIVKRFLLRRPIPRFLVDDIQETPPPESHPEVINFDLNQDDSSSEKYHRSMMIIGSGYSLQSEDPLFIDAYVDNVFIKRFHACSMQTLQSETGRSRKQYDYSEDLELSLTQLGHHQLQLVVQDIVGNILIKQLRISREPDPDHYNDYYTAGVPDVAEHRRLNKLGRGAVMFEIWIDASRDQDLWVTLDSFIEQGNHKPKLHIYGLAPNRRSDLENQLAKVPELQQLDIEYDQMPGDARPGIIVGEVNTYDVFIKAGERLSPYALSQAAELLSKNTHIDLLYTDHDLVDSSGIHLDPQFSPAWSPDYFLQHDYIGGIFFVNRTKWLIDCLQRVADFTEPNWRYELLLNFTDWPVKIENIPRVMWSTLYETNQDDIKKRVESVADCLLRRGEEASVEASSVEGLARLRWHADSSSRVSIIIPTTGNLELLKPCLDSIVQRTVYKNYELVIIVNGQGRFPEGIEYCRSLGLKIIVDDDPFNWSRLNNRAVIECSGDMFLFLNDDVEVLNGDWLQSMVSLARRSSIGTVGSMLLYPDGSIQHAGVVLVDHGGGAMHYFQWMNPENPVYNNLHQVTREVSASTGACLMVRRDVFLEAGGFSEAFEISGNDIDFCLRIQALGYRNLWTPDAQLIHKESMTRKKNTIPFRDEARMWRLWGEQFLARDPYYSSNFTNQAAVCELPKIAADP